MSSSVVLRGRGPLSRYSRTANVSMPMTTGRCPADHTPPPELARHVRLRAPGSAEDVQLDLRARLRGRTEP
ncbi:MAG TPA: hypothetical protein VGL06_20625 [Pseudonocardiaceae bacterium]|jgi:hypothetical protein